jgi:hypothetical protein
VYRGWGANQDLSSFKTQKMIATLTPSAMARCIIASFAVRVYVFNHNRAQTSRTHGFAVLTPLYLTLPSTPITIFKALLCDSRSLGENGEGYLIADYQVLIRWCCNNTQCTMQARMTLCLLSATVNCEGTEYTNFILLYGIVSMLAFPVGVNLLYVIIIFCHRAETHAKKKIEGASGSAVSFLHKPFTSSCFWWEAVDSLCAYRSVVA